MKKFKFSLSTVQKVRHRTEEVRKREFGEAVRKIESASARIRETGARAMELSGERKKQLTGPLDLYGQKVALQYHHHLERLLANQQQAWATASVEAENKRDLLVEAARQRKVIDLLHDRKHQEFQKQVEKEEQKILDEVASIAALRNKQGSEPI